MRRQIWLGNALLLTSPGIIGVLVGIGGYGQRYRYHPFTRFVFLGANTLFLPILSSVVSALSDSSNDYVSSVDNECTTPILAALCHSNFHPCIVITWAFLVQIAMINTTPVLAINPREGRNVGPSLELIVKVVWTFYLAASISRNRFFSAIFGVLHGKDQTSSSSVPICSKIMFAPFVLICAKVLFKFYAFEKARLSYELGRNAGLIFGYMQQLEQQQVSQHCESVVGEDYAPPPLLVMGEDSRQVVNQPCGYMFTNVSGALGTGNIGLVTLDKIWQLDNVLPMMPKLKDLCLSFALFKLLRCRFARYKITNVGSLRSVKLFCSMLLKDGEHDRVFRVIADELSFVHDYYYSSLSLSYAKYWVPILGVFLSLLSIAYCIVAAFFIVVLAAKENQNGQFRQIKCNFWCTKVLEVSLARSQSFGSLYFDVVPVFWLLALVLISEVRVIASYICSSFTKVALICHHANSSSLQHPQRMNKWVVSLLLKFRLNEMKHWDETVRQCSVLLLHRRANFFEPIWRRIPQLLPDQYRKVKIPAAVKICIFDVLRNSNSNELQLSKGTASLRRSQVGESFLWACNGIGTSDIILTWHIATSILEVRYPYRHDQEHGSSTICNQHKIAATHLSRYCGYLLTWSPELLPDEDEWSKSLCKDVKMDGMRVLAVWASTKLLTPEVEYQELVHLLREHSRHEVLKNGVKLAMQLVELVEGEDAAWAMLASFWAEMILYVAPSKNLRAHSKAIARGGELITLLWALLFHAGIVRRPGEIVGTSTADGVV
jgi:hypothetical protein